jgi:hypothetical protein
MEVVFANVLCQVFVSGDTRSLERLGRDLLDFIRDDVNNEGKFINGGLFLTDVVNLDFRVGHTSVVP